MPLPLPCTNPAIVTTPSSCDRTASPILNRQRRPSTALLHPDHARLLSLTLPNRNQPSPDQSSNEDLSDYSGHGKRDIDAHQQLYTASSSTTSSMTSIAGYTSRSHRYYYIFPTHLTPTKTQFNYLNRLSLLLAHRMYGHIKSMIIVAVRLL